MDGSSFLDIAKQDWLASNALAFAIPDGFPVSPGHALVITRRPISDWWQSTKDERLAIFALVDEVKTLLDTRIPAPDGYNVGFNAGGAAGQTVDHLHVHVIPRYAGDAADPRGGVRHVIPGRGNYLAEARPRQLANAPGRPLLACLADALADPRVDDVRLAVSFVMTSGLRLLDPYLLDLLARPGARLRILTTDYLAITEETALRRLLADQDSFAGVEIRIFSAAATSFHPKSYVLTSSTDDDAGYGFVGSANLSAGGLRHGVEWTLRTTDADAVDELIGGWEELWHDPRSNPLTQPWIDGYAQARRLAPPPVASEPPEQPPQPTAIQREALDALEDTRARGFGTGLVVLATGLGKTWLAAFDSSRPHFGRVLFIAHREEILRQAMVVFRAAQPTRTAGLLMAGVDESHAQTVFAGIQTLAARLDRYAPEEFDYIVVDEFHHAAASTYRRCLNHFRPRFLLGLTATPDRTDSADLVALCDDNLVIEVGLVDGIRRDALVPFHYTGVADTIDFAQIPWRNGKFDPTALEHAAITAQRAQAAFDAWQEHSGVRTLAFCVSMRHADHLAEFFGAAGIPCVAVHSGPSSAPRHQSLADLAAGRLRVVFSVDLFNEGLDLPNIDTVLLLRPTESPVVFLQQLGRGLRRAEGKAHLNAIDFVGNHRSFLNRPRLLLQLTGARTDPAAVRQALESGDFSLPDGCSVRYDVEALDLLTLLAGKATRGEALEAFVRSTWESEGRRPTALQTYRCGLNPATAQPRGGWFALLDQLDLLDPVEREAVAVGRGLLAEIAATAMTKAYKMVLLRALLMRGSLFDGVPLEELAESSRRLVQRDPRLLDDMRSTQVPRPEDLGPAAFARYWRKWPVAAWAGELSRADEPWVQVADGVFQFRPAIPEHLREPLSNLVAELVDWRLTRYLDTRPTPSVAILKVSHAGGRPILFLDRTRYPDLPTGPTPVMVDGVVYEFDFVKIAINVARRDGERTNCLPELLRAWLGDGAGLPGSEHRVGLERSSDSGLVLVPMRFGGSAAVS